MEDRTFYYLSYAAFCLALIVPFFWVVFRASRAKPKQKKNKQE